MNNELVNARERKLDFQFLTYVSSTFVAWKLLAWFPYNLQDWPATYDLYIHQNICKMIKYIKLASVSKNGNYFSMHRLADKCTQWLTLFRQLFCTKLRKRVKIQV